jgi:hypothetical protein
MASKTEICNIAISHLGIGTEIANIDTEDSEPARACRRFYDRCLETVLREFAWPFATRVINPALVEEDPTTEWGYSYRYPVDCLIMKKIQSGLRTDTSQSRAPYRIVGDDSGSLIYTDCEDAVIEYTALVEDVDNFASDFVMAFSYKLAHYIAPRISGGDPFALQERIIKLYVLELSQAERSAYNEEQPDQEAFSEFDRERW